LLLLSAVPYLRAVQLTEADIANRRCVNCHSQQRLGEMPPEQRLSMVAKPTTPVDTAAMPATRPGLVLSGEMLASSVHKSAACVDCHRDAQQLPHALDLKPVSCNESCHANQTMAFRQSVHAEALAANNPMAPTCATCHGDHDIQPSESRNSRTFPLRVIKLCGDCHAKHQGKTSNGDNHKHHVQSYLDSVHGQAVQKSGLIVSATCVDCHGSHQVLPGDREASTISRRNIPETCGQCHQGINDVFRQSVHGKPLPTDKNRELVTPVCTDCHTAHAISRTDMPAFKLDIVNECGSCHDKPPQGSTTGRSLYQTYRMSYHGQVTRLGYARAARCSDCHGAHDVRPVDDPTSRMHADNRLEACQTCHEGAGSNFTSFSAHADYRDARRYPLLHGVWLYFIIAMSGSFGFFGLHSVLWLGRNLVDRIKHGPYPKPRYGAHGIKRFSALDRWNHAFVMITFFGLALTGLPLFYSDHGWAQWATTLFGGVGAMGIIHRVFGVMLIINFIVHVAGILRRAAAYGRHVIRDWLLGPASMLPRWKDVQDLRGMFRWFFHGGRKPRFGHWTYWEKFDYGAEIFGSLVIGGSGLMLWFPEFFSHYLPGWMFNVATIIHGYEALLAIGFIFSIHFFNAHLRLEKFPVDDVMFTGSVPEEEFIHEREEEYEQLKQAGKLDELKVPPPPPWQRRVAHLAGIVALIIGVVTVALIIAAALAA
jgi:cytochrome b subunit of formate dehydrogenase